jgi:pro-sigmaK processing inhibitor BofA
MVDIILAGLVILTILILGWDIVKKLAAKASTLILNSVAGVLILLFLNVFLGWGIPIKIATLVVCGLFGIPGVGTLVILYLDGMI